ncbi:MAG: hypothetical protein JO343_06345 [Candidatus Eremiobacteraeota bacterium]|nr:hypothetical protein [Candidatus Eremiobacteraeota bacterium]MBV8461221.1 hypothetical protein [Candidatus Eremiobacteraeota bacterium]MBV8596542.1 hypothetical protein [Candidatus Eremiobacteraeota bacterium]
MRLRITPQPTADEAAAIEAALAMLAARRAPAMSGLRYGDRRRASDARLTWTDVARLEALGDD